MTYKEALQIAIEELYERSGYFEENFTGFVKHQAYAKRLLEARDLLRKVLEDAEKKFEFKNEPINFMPLEETPENFERSHQKEREWVGLTKDDINEMIVDVWLRRNRYAESEELRWFAGLIEDKLKDKNT